MSAPPAAPPARAAEDELAALLRGTPYVSYAYAYPHKTAYRRFDPPLPLDGVWREERRTALCLYLHVPFCEMRCGFCNLFTTTGAPQELEAAYLDALERQARRVAAALGGAAFARMAIGGGTPTALPPAALDRLFDLAAERFGIGAGAVPVSVEASPGTATPERLRALRRRGVSRISLGVQSFVQAEVAAAGRAQRAATVAGALDAIRAAGFPTLNVDLIYGLPGQTVASWLGSLETALRWAPEELYLYPLYVRPLTGLQRRAQRTAGTAGTAGRAGGGEAGGGEDGGAGGEDRRPALYAAGRARLLAAGYTQVSMRMFRAPGAPDGGGPVYDCQEDGTVGLGCGARSYTRTVHYASEYAVGARGVRAILADYVARPEAGFDAVEHGVVLDREEQTRRYAIQSVLQANGLSRPAYRARFGRDVLEDLPQLEALEGHGLATRTAAALRLTPAGLARSDVIGPWLYSAAVRRRSAAYELV